MTDPQTQRNPRIAAAGATDAGKVRLHNEDAVLVRPDLGLFLVADGAGGQNAGNVASMLAVAAVAHHFESTAPATKTMPPLGELGMSWSARRLSRAVQSANREVIEVARSRNTYQGMGTTLVALAFSGDASKLDLAHVGDSRCYRLRDAALEQLTEDHSLANDILELRPDLDDAVIRRLPKNVITRAVGMGDPLRVSLRSLSTRPGDRYLLCSDGVTNCLDDQTISDLLRVSKTPDEAVRALIDTCNEGGAPDNLAAIVVDLVPPPGEPMFPSHTYTPANAPKARVVRSPIDESAPEIVILGLDEGDGDDSTSFRVIPAESSSPNLLADLGNYAAPLRKKTPPPIPPAATAQNCRACGKPMGHSLVCPSCGAPR